MMYKRIESEDYFKKFHILWDDRTEDGCGKVRFCNQGVFSIKTPNYPKYFKQADEIWDPYQCSFWYEIPKEEYLAYVAELIKEKQAEIDELNKILLE